jgi:gliding motility-associated-like protein
MSYEYIGNAANGNLRYKITLNVYRDCFQSDVPLDDEIPLGIYLNNSNKDRYAVANFRLLSKYKVEAPGSVDCDYYKDKVCIEYGLYEGIIELAQFTEGYHITFVRCCRNKQTNLPDQGGSPFQGQTYYCFIPNTTYENSSPVFSGVPSPYMCANDTTTFLFNAFDPDGDELSYKIVRPFQGGSPTTNGALPDPPLNLSLPIQPVQYNAGYNEIRPFGTNNGSVSTVNPVTGLVTFFAPSIGSYVVGIEVTEKRNSVVLSTIRMDLQILVLDCPPNDRPTISSNSGQSFIIEAGEKLCFDVTGKDKNNDLIKLTGTGPVLQGNNGFTGTRATFLNASGIGEVTSTFCWETDCDHARTEPYNVNFTVQDDGCPPKFNYLDVSIIVTPFKGTLNITGPTDVCRYNSYAYEATGGSDSSTYEWRATNGAILTGNGTSKVVIDWNGQGSGSVEMREISKHGCIGDWAKLNISIKESPPTPNIIGKDTVCLNENLSYSVALNPANAYEWFVENATLGNANKNVFTLSTYGKPTFKVKVIETNSFGCSSDTGEIVVFVSEPLPIITGPKTVCPNSQNIKYSSSTNFGSQYSWGVSGGTRIGSGSSPSIFVNWGNAGVGEVEVIETNRHGCVSPLVSLSVTKTYDLVANPIVGPTDVCEFDLGIGYSTLGITGSTFNWTITGGNKASGDSSNAITVDWGAAGVGKISMQEKAYDVVNNRLCLSNVETLNVTINPKPVANEIAGTMELCQSTDTFVYSISGYIGSTYQWSVNGNSTNIVGQGSNTIKVVWNTAGSFTLAVLETSKANCPGDLVDTIILVNPKPNTAAIVGNAIICEEIANSQVYTVSGFPTSTYQWIVKGANNFIGQGSNSITVDWEPTVNQASVEVVEISDKGCLGDTQKLAIELDRLKIDLRYVSVGSPDNRMIINWRLAEITSTNEFIIEKRKAGFGEAWQELTTTSGSIFNYTEMDINTDNNAFEYRIKAVNKCGRTVYSEPHTNILLQGYKDENFDINLTFSDYLGWDNGVSNYTIYESINNGAFMPLEAGVNPNENTLIENNPDQYKKCYRVYANEFMGERTNSWSNEICFFFSPELYVPNAFTPTGDNLNDGFGVVGVAIKDYNIKIYNRWGEQLWESNSIAEKWIPVYRGADVQMGTYIYVITYSNFDNELFTKTGTINLIK